MHERYLPVVHERYLPVVHERYPPWYRGGIERIPTMVPAGIHHPGMYQAYTPPGYVPGIYTTLYIPDYTLPGTPLHCACP